MKYSVIVAFFRIFLFTHIFPTLIISNAGLGTKKKSNDFYYRLTFFVFQENSPKNILFSFCRKVKTTYF